MRQESERVLGEDEVKEFKTRIAVLLQELDVKNKENQFNQTLITIKYSKVELLETPLEFPFKVPAKLLKP